METISTSTVATMVWLGINGGIGFGLGLFCVAMISGVVSTILESIFHARKDRLESEHWDWLTSQKLDISDLIRINKLKK